MRIPSPPIYTVTPHDRTPDEATAEARTLDDDALIESAAAARDAGFYARLMGTTSTSRVSARMGSWSS